MSFLEKKVEDLKLMVPGEVRRCCVPFCDDTDIPKDESDLAYGRYEPVYTEMELLDIYQDLLGTHVPAPDPVESAVDEFEEQANDRTLVHSLISRLDEHPPPEPGTSQSHAMGVDSQEAVTRYRRTISRLEAIIQDPDTKIEHPHPSPSTSKVEQQTLPSPLEWAALIRECVGTLQDGCA